MTQPIEHVEQPVEQPDERVEPDTEPDPEVATPDPEPEPEDPDAFDEAVGEPAVVAAYGIAPKR